MIAAARTRRAGLAAAAAWGLAAAAAPRPNLILIMADDLGYECVGANGGESYRTPNLDRLAASGVRFEQCHVQPLCTPTRVELMTGKVNARNYVRFGLLPRGETTFAHVLKAAGYATGVCGKWQLGKEPDSPRHFGFNEACLWQHTRRPPRYANPGLEYNGVEKDFSNGEYGPTLINEFALDFVERHRDRPFFLYYPMILTHSPFQPTPDSPNWNPRAVGEQANNKPAHFADMVAYMDKMVGRLDARLADLGLRDGTLLLFTGDNGTGGGIVSRFQGADYPGGKGSTTARGTRVPLIASWPGVVREGRVVRDLVCSTDFLPTLCEAAGVSAPAGIDGVSFLPQIRGETGAPRAWIYKWYSPRNKPDLTVREFAFDHGHKLYADGRLFDLTADPFEKSPLPARDLSENAAVARAKLAEALARYRNVRPPDLDAAAGATAPEATPAADTPARRRNRR